MYPQTTPPACRALVLRLRPSQSYRTEAAQYADEVGSLVILGLRIWKPRLRYKWFPPRYPGTKRVGEPTSVRPWSPAPSAPTGADPHGREAWSPAPRCARARARAPARPPRPLPWPGCLLAKAPSLNPASLRVVLKVSAEFWR